MGQGALTVTRRQLPISCPSGSRSAAPIGRLPPGFPSIQEAQGTSTTLVCASVLSLDPAAAQHRRGSKPLVEAERRRPDQPEAGRHRLDGQVRPFCTRNPVRGPRRVPRHRAIRTDRRDHIHEGPRLRPHLLATARELIELAPLRPYV